MKFEVYCDESHPDLLSSKHPTAKFMMIGSIWLKASDRALYKTELHQLKKRHMVGSEVKWRKVSPSRLAFYLELVSWFLSKGEELRFRCIAVEQDKIDLHRFHGSDQELGFYKFYYQMLQQWILDFNDYAVFCDHKSNRSRDRLAVLKRCLECSNFAAEVSEVQAIRSRDSVLIQLADVLTGAASAKLNDPAKLASAKCEVIRALEDGLHRPIAHTLKSEQKFNVFVINLQGGW